MSAVTCFRCQQVFENKKRVAPLHCSTCKAAIRRKKERERHNKAEAVLTCVLPDSSDIVTLADRGKLLSLAMEVSMSTRDKQPDGWQTPAGSADGRSTYCKVFAGELDTLAKEAMGQHTPRCDADAAYAEVVEEAAEWWANNPHWYVGLS